MKKIVQKFINSALQFCNIVGHIIKQNKESLKKVAELLLKKEVIFKEDLESVMGSG